MPPLSYLRTPPCVALDTSVVQRDATGIVIPEAVAYWGSQECAADRIHVIWQEERYSVSSITLTADGQHLACNVQANPGDTVSIMVDAARRQAISRTHTLLHAAQGLLSQQFPGVVVRKALAEVDAAKLELTGLDDQTVAALGTFEVWFNERLQSDLAVRTYLVGPEEARAFPARWSSSHAIPHSNDMCVVEINGLHAQLSSGPHLQFTGDVGPVTVNFEEIEGDPKAVLMRLTATPAVNA